MPDVTPVEAQETKEVNKPASAIMAELIQIQEDPIKTAITGLDIGSTFFPQDDGTYVPLDVTKVLDPLSPVQEWQKRGFSDEDLRSGIVQIKRGNPVSQNEMYRYGKGISSLHGVADTLWMSRTGTILRRSGDPENFTFEKSEGPQDPRYKETLDRINQLSQIPYKIRAQFESYEHFARTYLSETGQDNIRDTQITTGVLRNGIDYYARDADGGPWRVFQLEDGNNPFKQFVDAVGLNSEELDERIDSANWQLRGSVDGNPHGSPHGVIPHAWPDSPRASEEK